MFEQLKYLRDPETGQENHYKAFSEVSGTQTTYERTPPLVTKEGAALEDSPVYDKPAT